jgi:DNA-directed RNA polymerase subunit M/transcription elongation factor TFIIS
MIHSCPNCSATGMYVARQEEGCRVYRCPNCQHTVETVEVLATEMRRLVMASMDLTRRQVQSRERAYPPLAEGA